MAERSFVEEVKLLKLGAGEQFHGEGILAVTKALLESGVVTGDQLSRATAQRFGLYHVDLTLFKTDIGALNVIPAQMARRLGAAPIGYDDSGRLLVAMSDPSNVLALDDLKLRTGR